MNYRGYTIKEIHKELQSHKLWLGGMLELKHRHGMLKEFDVAEYVSKRQKLSDLTALETSYLAELDKLVLKDEDYE